MLLGAMLSIFMLNVVILKVMASFGKVALKPPIFAFESKNYECMVTTCSDLT
jgi:hypothetical protein